MSCEQLRTNLDLRRTQLPEKTRERVNVSYFIQYLTLSCKEDRSRKTHTSKLASPQSEVELDELWERTRRQAEAYLDSLNTESEREIVFGQAFHPNDDSSESIFVVTDTLPQHNPNSISAAQVVVTESGTERLGLPGGIVPEDIGQAQEVWSVDRIIKAMGMTFKGNLPEDMQKLFRENAAKPARKVYQ